MVRDNPWIENEDEYSETFSCKLCFGTENREKVRSNNCEILFYKSLWFLWSKKNHKAFVHWIPSQIRFNVFPSELTNVSIYFQIVTFEEILKLFFFKSKITEIFENVDR